MLYIKRVDYLCTVPSGSRLINRIKTFKTHSREELLLQTRLGFFIAKNMEGYQLLQLRDKYSEHITRVKCTRYEQGGEVNSRVAYAFILAAENGLDIDSVFQMHDRKGDLEVTFQSDGIYVSDAIALGKAWEECGECKSQVRMYQL